MFNGWVKLWRKSLKSGWLQNPELWTFWCWCLMKATHKEIDQTVGYQQIHLMPGQFIFGRLAASKELKMSERKIRTSLDSLRKRQNIAIKTTNKFSIISIINWDTYQGQENENDQLTDQQPTSNRPATDHKQECKECKNEKNKNILSVSTETDLTKNQKRIEKLKTEKQVIKEKIRSEFEQHRSFLQEKFPAHDLSFELSLMLNWVDTNFAKAKRWANGNLNLAFQNWMRRAKPQNQNQQFNLNEDPHERARRISAFADKIGRIPE